MHWIAPSEKDALTGHLGKRLWDTADTATCASTNPEREAIWRDFRKAKDHWNANASLMTKEYSNPIHFFRRTRDLLLPRLLSGQVELETEAA